MNTSECSKVESYYINEFSQLMRKSITDQQPQSSSRIDLHPDNVKNGLGKLVLTLLKLINELLERQAIRRMEGGDLTEIQIERLGLTLMKQAEEIEKLRELFGLTTEDLNLDLGPLGKLL